MKKVSEIVSFITSHENTRQEVIDYVNSLTEEEMRNVLITATCLWYHKDDEKILSEDECGKLLVKS